MSRQYLRTYQLTIKTTDGKFRRISGLRISFEVSKTINSTANLAKIVVYNPNSETLSMLQKEDTTVELSVGYGGFNSLLFLGQVRNLMQPRTQTESTAEIYAVDGKAAMSNSYFNRAYSPTISAGTVISDIIDSLNGVVRGSINGLPQTKDNLRGLSLSGNSSDLMDTMADQYGLNWSVHNGEVNVTPTGTPLANYETNIISADTGMVGSPTITDQGVEVTTLLNTRLIPESRFTIMSPNANSSVSNLQFLKVKRTVATGNYRVITGIFTGDTESDEWYSKINGKILK